MTKEYYRDPVPIDSEEGWVLLSPIIERIGKISKAGLKETAELLCPDVATPMIADGIFVGFRINVAIIIDEEDNK